MNISDLRPAGAMMKRARSIRTALAAPAKRLRRRTWDALTAVLPLVPSGKVGRALRYQLIKATKFAPLDVCVAKGDTVVLVGVVQGGEVWDMVRLVGESGRVIAVEPFPEGVKALEERCRRDGIRNVTVVPKGAWSERGTQHLYIHPVFAGSNIVLDSGARHDRALRPEEYAEAIEIHVERLDDILASLGIETCDFIKITVMGSELQVLKGMTRFLAGHPTLWVKAHSLVDGEPANGAISNLLREHGYRTVVIEGNKGPDGIRPGDVYASR